MIIPEAGWLPIDAQRPPEVFIPLYRYQRQPVPSEITVTMGKKYRTRVKLQKQPSSAKMIPARIRQSEHGDYQMGPFIGILTADGNGTFLGNRQNFADLIQKGKQMGVTVFVITPRGFKPNQSVVNGYYYVNKRWISAVFPLPNVVYNRVPSRQAEHTKEIQETISRIKHLGIPLFNPRFFDKWSLYQILSEHDELKRLLPQTVRFDSNETLKQMILRHSALFLKPVEGKAGIGMMRMCRTPQGVEMIYQGAREKKRYITKRLSTLSQIVNTFSQKRPYLIQQAIPLAKFKDRPFDVRMLYQKNGSGQWGLTGAGIRVAGATAISTHVPMGGRIESIDHVLDHVFSGEAKSLYQKLEKTGLEIAKWIEYKQGGLLGEMSMDIGIDQNRNIWFFEANAKPMKFDEPEIRERSLRRIIQYGLHLSGFSEKVGVASL
jgi:hypothetical protein